MTLPCGSVAVAEDDEHDARKAEKDARDGEACWAGALQAKGEQQRPDRRGCVEHSGDAAGDSAFAEGEEAERDCVVEERDKKQRDDEAAWRQGAKRRSRRTLQRKAAPKLRRSSATQAGGKLRPVISMRMNDAPQHSAERRRS